DELVTWRDLCGKHFRSVFVDNVANPLVTFTLHLVGEVQLATADVASREILEAKVKKFLTSKAWSKRIDKEGASSLLSAASDMAWRNTLWTGVKELFFGRG
ncbi:unnamed protein product, partial [Ascophyllum nodosum]